MLKKLIRIFCILIILMVAAGGNTYATIGTGIDKKITNWYSGSSDGLSDEQKKELYQEILKNLKDDFEYTGDTVNNEMKVHTTISVVSKKKISDKSSNDKYKYTIRIRKRNK